jgi:F-type H+-transporting ATPase subunit delta
MATVGTVYAKAVFELSSPKGEAEQVSRQLRDFWETVQSHAGLRAVLVGPGAEANSRKRILADISASLGLAGVSKRVLELLAARGRVGQLPEIMDQLDSMIETSKGVMVGKVRSAVELSADELSVLSASLAKKVGGRVRLQQEVDPSLLGGVVATVGGRTYDASLRAQIERFKNELI